MPDNNKPGAVYTLDLHEGGTLVLTGTTSIEMTLMDAEGNGSMVELNDTAAQQVSNALFVRVQMVQALKKASR